LLGYPSWSFQASRSSYKQLRNVYDGLGMGIYDDLNIYSDLYSINATFNKENLSWGLSISDSIQQDKVHPDNEEKSVSHGFDLNLHLSDAWSVSSSIQNQKTYFAFDDSVSESRIYDFAVQWSIANRTNGNLAYNLFESGSDSVSFAQDSSTQTLNLQLVWNWIVARPGKPGFDISVTGSRQEQTDHLNSENDSSSYQYYLSLTMNMAVESEGGRL
jgi:hypothetical protein